MLGLFRGRCASGGRGATPGSHWGRCALAAPGEIWGGWRSDESACAVRSQGGERRDWAADASARAAAFAGKVRTCTLSSIVLRQLNLELNLHSENISNMD